LAQLPSLGFLLRLAPLETQIASPLAREIPNGSQLGLASSEDSYGNNVRRSFLSAWMNRDSINNILRNGYSYTETNPGQLETVASQLLANQPTYAALIVSTTQTQLVQQLKDLPNPPADPMRATQIVVSDTARNDDMLALAGRPDMAQHMRRLRGVGPLSLATSIEATEFKTGFQSRYPSDRLASDLYVGYAYDAVYVAAAAMNSIKGEVTGQAVLGVLRRMTNSMKVLPLSRVTFADTVRLINQGDTFTLNGATGPIRFTPEGSRDPSLFERWTFDTSVPGQASYVSTPL
jgi:ABC-type branched-subunit amino acid transport system substrate-binding protein